MQIHCTYDALVPLKDLKSHPKNRNKHPEKQIARLAKILAYQGWRYPIKISKRSGFVTSGHGRIEAAKYNLWDKVPVNYQNYDDDAQEYADLTADNSIASWAELDLAGINIDVADLGPDFDIDLLGIEGFVLEPADKYQGDEDAIPETNIMPICKRGDLYLLDGHRLLCGDSTIKENIDKLMNGAKADMVFTSPPYNVGLDYNSYDDSLSVDDYRKLLSDVMERIKEVAAECFAICWNKGAWMHPCDYRMDINLLEEKWGIKRTIVWKKKGITGPPIFAHTQNNPVIRNYMPFFGWEFIFTCQTGGKGITKIPENVLQRRMTDIWEVDQSVDSSNQSGHPGAFPVQLVADAIALYGDNIVLDPFCGSGSTLIACEKTNRKCYGMEIDPHYCDVIIKRWETYTGKKACLVQE